jgi:hypothetical protein
MDLRNLVLLFAAAALSACSSSSPNTPTGSAGASQGDAGDSSSAGDATTAGATGSAGAAHGGGGATGSAGTPAHGGGGASGAPGEGGSGGAACTKCPSKCCDTGALCIDDGLGNLSCKKPCTTSSQCPSAAQCCEVLKDGTGACAAPASDSVCHCTTGVECTSKACAPLQDAMGNPAGPYVCVPNDGMPYNGCNGLLTSCKGAGTCCFTDALANQFCASECTNDSQCGNAACVTYSNANTTCGGMLGCGPK